MSEIKYKLSALISQESIDELCEMQKKIENCGNDKLIIETDCVLYNTAILDLIKIIHTCNNSSANKELYVQHPIKKW